MGADLLLQGREDGRAYARESLRGQGAGEPSRREKRAYPDCEPVASFLLRIARTIPKSSLLRRIRTWSSVRSEEHTSELQSLMRISYAVFCLKKKNKTKP